MNLDNLQSQPPEILEHIISFLDLRALLNLATATNWLNNFVKKSRAFRTAQQQNFHSKVTIFAHCHFCWKPLSKSGFFSPAKLPYCSSKCFHTRLDSYSRVTHTPRRYMEIEHHRFSTPTIYTTAREFQKPVTDKQAQKVRDDYLTERNRWIDVIYD